MAWYWDFITIYGPCLTWEFCNCGKFNVAYWKSGRPKGVALECEDCGARNYTLTVFATAN